MWLAPEREDVLPRPGAVDEDEVRAAASEGVEESEETIIAGDEDADCDDVQLLGKGEEWVGGDEDVVVELRLAENHAMQHVGADGGVMCVRENPGGGNELNNGVSEGEAGGVDEKVWNELTETFEDD